MYMSVRVPYIVEGWGWIELKFHTYMVDVHPFVVYAVGVHPTSAFMCVCSSKE